MNIINKLFNQIKLLFSKKNEEILSELKLDESNEILIDEQNEVQKELENININEVEESINSVEIGDIIWAKRYNDEIEKQQIPIGHQEGPYIIIGKSKNKFLCSQGTSTEPEKKFMDGYLEFGPNNYNLNKKTYFNIRKFEFVNHYSFVKKIDSLKKEDLAKILRMMKQRNSYYISRNLDSIKMKISSGDIIKVNNRNYIVISINENIIKCVRLQTNKINIKIDDLRSLDYGRLFEFNANTSIEYKATLNNILYTYVKKMEKEYRKNYENQTVTQRGSVILKDEELNYVYGEEGQKWLTFIISKRCSGLSDTILIKNSKYYTEYYTKIIDKKDDFKTISLAFTEEIDEIRNLKKTYKYRLEEIKKENRKKYYNSRKSRIK